MRRMFFASLLTIVLVTVVAARQNDVVGTWTGTWEGGGNSGGFELTLTKGDDGNLACGVSVTGEPTYKAACRTVKFDGKKMAAAYDFPPDPTIEVELVATFEDNSANGAWTARPKAGGADLATGSWSVKKK